MAQAVAAALATGPEFNRVFFGGDANSCVNTLWLAHFLGRVPRPGSIIADFGGHTFVSQIASNSAYRRFIDAGRGHLEAITALYEDARIKNWADRALKGVTDALLFLRDNDEETGLAVSSSGLLYELAVLAALGFPEDLSDVRMPETLIFEMNGDGVVRLNSVVAETVTA
jgi:hypothetical protein